MFRLIPQKFERKELLLYNRATTGELVGMFHEVEMSSGEGGDDCPVTQPVSLGGEILF